MDIAALRLGFAHHALRRALGDELSPISFAQGSFAFIDRSCGARFFCSADNSALSILAFRDDGALAGADDEGALAAAAELRARAEPDYLASWGAFARDFDRANSTEARAAARSAQLPIASEAARSGSAPAAVVAPDPRLDEPAAPARQGRAQAPRPAPSAAEPLPAPDPISAPAPRFTRAPRKAPAR